MTADQGASECSTQSAGGTLPGGLPLGVGDLRVPLVPGLPGLPLPTPPGVSVPGFGSIDLGPAVRALAAPTGDLLNLRAMRARVTGQCSGGTPSLIDSVRPKGRAVVMRGRITRSASRSSGSS